MLGQRIDQDAHFARHIIDVTFVRAEKLAFGDEARAASIGDAVHALQQAAAGSHIVWP